MLQRLSNDNSIAFFNHILLKQNISCNSWCIFMYNLHISKVLLFFYKIYYRHIWSLACTIYFACIIPLDWARLKYTLWFSILIYFQVVGKHFHQTLLKIFQWGLPIELRIHASGCQRFSHTETECSQSHREWMHDETVEHTSGF